MISTFSLGGQDVPRVGYGMSPLARKTAENGERSAAIELLRYTFDLGVRHFDTAQFYANGTANELLNEALGDVREQLHIASKAGAEATPNGPAPMAAAQHPADIRRAVEDNLQSLGSDYLDLLYLRRMDMAPGLLAPEDQRVPLEAQLEVAAELRSEGLIKGIGLSHVSYEQVESSLDVGIDAVQNIYNFAHRDDQPLLELTQEHGIAWIPYFPLGGSVYAKLPRVTEQPEILAKAEELSVTPTQVGLAWLLKNSPNTFVISGTTSRDHLEENVESDSQVRSRL